MNGVAIYGRRSHIASLVLRPVDALREAMRRPVDERGPLGPVRLQLAGRVDAGTVNPLPQGAVRMVRNLSGDTVFLDLALPAGTYRVELVREPRDRRSAFYEDLDPSQRDVQWDPDVPSLGLPDGTPHMSKLVELRLRPSPLYPFTAGSTLVRGSLLWYDGAPLTGALVREPSALVPESHVDMHGSFVLVFAPAAQSGAFTVELQTADVDVAVKQSGAAYLAQWPSQWPVQVRRGATVSMRQPALTGRILSPNDRPLANASVTLVGRAGMVDSGAAGRWRYHFPPATQAGTVDIVIQHPEFAAVQLSDVPFAADATVQAPVVRLT